MRASEGLWYKCGMCLCGNLSKRFLMFLAWNIPTLCVLCAGVGWNWPATVVCVCANVWMLEMTCVWAFGVSANKRARFQNTPLTGVHHTSNANTFACKHYFAQTECTYSATATLGRTYSFSTRIGKSLLYVCAGIRVSRVESRTPVGNCLV